MNPGEEKPIAVYTDAELFKAVEAVLFAAGCPVRYEKLADAFGIDIDTLKEKIKLFASSYDERGIELIAYGDDCRLCTKGCYEGVIKSALDLRRSGTLSNSSLETLAVIARSQPVTRAYVEQVRGVDSSYAVSMLADKGLIEAKGRLDVPGRPVLYGTTEEFLRLFGLNSPEEIGDLTDTGGGTTSDNRS